MKCVTLPVFIDIHRLTEKAESTAMWGLALIDLSHNNRFYWQLVLNRYFRHCAQTHGHYLTSEKVHQCVFLNEFKQYYVDFMNPVNLKEIVWFFFIQFPYFTH